MSNLLKSNLFSFKFLIHDAAEKKTQQPPPLPPPPGDIKTCTLHFESYNNTNKYYNNTKKEYNKILV